MPKLMRDIAYFLCFTMIMMHLIPLVLLLADPIVRKTIFKGTYVDMIIGNEPFKEKVQKALDNFNEMGYNNAVKYKGIRPIIIREGPLEGDVIGQASVLPTYCSIVIDSTLPRYLFEETLQHEYVHCFGYGHSPIKCSLMYWNVQWCPHILKDISKTKFAREIARDFYK